MASLLPLLLQQSAGGETSLAGRRLTLTLHRLAQRVLVAALPLAAVAIAGGQPHSSGLGSAISSPSVGTAAAAPSTGVLLRRPGVLKSDVLETYGRVPLQFETNLGQTDFAVKFLARGPGYMVFLTPSEAVLALRSPQLSDQTPVAHAPWLDRRGTRLRERKAALEPGAAAVRLRLAGANPNPDVAGVEPLPGKVNYFRGNDQQRYQHNREQAVAHTRQGVEQ